MRIDLVRINNLVDILDDSTEGIFYNLFALLTDTTDPLYTLFSTYEQLDQEYYLLHSGDKWASQFYMKMIEANKSMSDIAKVILNKFKVNWNKLYQALNASYNPINNYDMVEHEEVNSKLKVTSNSKRYGFNTTEDNPVGDMDMENESSGNKDDNFRDLTRSGNIGVTTSQQMISSEVELRRYKLIDIIMNDIDTMLCLKIY